jgi:hypothetical protein
MKVLFVWEEEEAGQTLDTPMDRLATATFVIASAIKALREGGVTQVEMVTILASIADELIRGNGHA